MGWLTARISSAFTVGAYTGGGTGTSNRASIVENQSLTFRVDDPTGDSVAGEPLTRFQIAFLDGSLSETLPTSFALEDFGAGGTTPVGLQPDPLRGGRQRYLCQFFCGSASSRTPTYSNQPRRSRSHGLAETQDHLEPIPKKQSPGGSSGRHSFVGLVRLWLSADLPALPNKGPLSVGKRTFNANVCFAPDFVCFIPRCGPLGRCTRSSGSDPERKFGVCVLPGRLEI